MLKLVVFEQLMYFRRRAANVNNRPTALLSTDRRNRETLGKLYIDY